MNPPWQPPDPKRFRPNEPTNDHPWIPPPHHNPPLNHQPHVHPSRQSQLPPPPPPPIAPYHQPHPQNLPPAPYYPPPQNLPPPYQPPPYYPSHNPQQQPHPHPQTHSRRNKSSDPRQRPPMYHNHNHTNLTPNHNKSENNKSEKSGAILDVLHIASDETKNFGDFAVTLSQIYGSRNMDGLPFGSSSSQSIEFDGRIRSEPILSFLPEAIDTPSKKVRVYELSPLASRDARSYDELLAFFTKNERCPVVDKEYNMGILLYFVPPKLIFKKVDPNKNKNPKNKKNKKNKRKTHRINFMELLKLNGDGDRGKLSEDKVWMISITSTSKYLLFKQKMKEKENGRNDKKNFAEADLAELSDIEISDDDDESGDDGGDGMDVSSGGDEGKKSKVDDIEKSELIVALEQLYKKIGQKLPD